MAISIKGTEPLYELVGKHPEIKEIMVELGFKDIVKPGMLQSVGRVMTIEKGARMKSIDLALIKRTLEEHGFLLV